MSQRPVSARPYRVLLCLATAACGGREIPFVPADLAVREPIADSIESVVYLIGDAGHAVIETSPVVHRLRSEANSWSANLPDSSVVLLYLGDNVYPGGIHDPTEPEYPQDSVHMQSQLFITESDSAVNRGVRAIFIPGNHDWGHKAGAPGVQRLRNMQDFIDRNSRSATFLPRDGKAGPAIVDLGRHLRIIIIDTAWWLLEADRDAKLAMTAGVERAIASAGRRGVVIASHHPWASGSSHGGLTPFWKTLGVKWLLNKSGAALQDINSLPYRDLKNQLIAVFRSAGRPLLYAGGHDHALQVVRGPGEEDPLYSVVSGAASKTSKVGPTPGGIFRRDEPGYMRLVVMKNGAIDLFVVTANDDFLECEGSEARIAQCLDVGVREFRNVFSVRLR